MTKIKPDDERLIQYEDEISAMYNGVISAMEKDENIKDVKKISKGEKRSLHNIIFRMRKEQKKKGIKGIPKNISEDGMVRNYEAFFWKQAQKYANERFPKPLGRRKWTTKELDLIIRMRGQGAKWKDITKESGRSYSATYGAWYRMKRRGDV